MSTRLQAAATCIDATSTAAATSRRLGLRSLRRPRAPAWVRGIRGPGGATQRSAPESSLLRPQDDYLTKLGWANYAFLYLEWSVLWALSDGTSISVIENSSLTPRRLFNAFRLRFGIDPSLSGLVDRYDDVVSRREDLVHSHPATQRDWEHDEGHQRLFRHETRRDPASPRVFWITPDWLDQFASDALALEREIHALRTEDRELG